LEPTHKPGSVPLARR